MTAAIMLMPGMPLGNMIYGTPAASPPPGKGPDILIAFAIGAFLGLLVMIIWGLLR